MKLDEYLEAIRNCPDELVIFDDSGSRRELHRLTTEFGVYDNWPIQLRVDFDKVIKDLSVSGKYLLFDQTDMNSKHKYFKRRARFNYIPGTVELQVCTWPFTFLDTEKIEN